MSGSAAASSAIEACGHIVEAASRSCVTAAQVQTVPGHPEPNWDAAATSLTALSTAFVYGSLLLALLTILAGLAWGKIVITTAEREARETAEKEARKIAKSLADSYMREWLAKEAPEICRAHIDLTMSATLNGQDGNAADAIGDGA